MYYPNSRCKSESRDTDMQELCRPEYQWRTGILLDQMNCTKKQHSLIYETEYLLDLIYDNFGSRYFFF